MKTNMTKPLHQLYLLLPLVFITWWTLTFGFKTPTSNANRITLDNVLDINLERPTINDNAFDCYVPPSQ